jgi:NitT/TauT family transport system substrate-binding protein
MFRAVRRIICLITMGCFFLACGDTKPTLTRPADDVQLRQEWFPFSGFAGEVSGAKHFAATENINLHVVPGSEEVDPIKLVLSGTADFAVVSGDLLVAAVAKGAPLVAIGVVNYKSPTCFLVRANSGIKSPSDFQGKRVGILTGTNTEKIYQLMMQRAGIERSKVKEIQVPFELQTFILGQYDVRPAFIYDEPVSLEQQGISYEVIDPAQYDVNFIGTVYFTRQDVVRDHADLVQRLVDTLALGWRFALDKPDISVQELVSEFPDLKADRERRSLELGRDYFTGEDGKPLYVSADRWQTMIRGLEEIHAIEPNTVTADQVWNSSFIQHFYDKQAKSPN